MKRLVPHIFVGIGAAAAVLAVAGYVYYVREVQPGLVQSGILRNEAAAIAALKEYVRAQREFSERGYAAVPGNTSPNLGDGAYADNFRNLYYGRDAEGRPLALVSREFANAHLGETAGALTVPMDPPKSMRRDPYSGYLFLEDFSGDLRPAAYGERFALMALPWEPHKTGSGVFWTDDRGRMLVHAVHPDVKTLEELISMFLGVQYSTPLESAARYAWTEL